MTNISFTSGIKAVSNRDFNKNTMRIDETCYAAEPWGIEHSVKGIKAYTKRISDCTMLGVTDGQNVYILHGSPLQKSSFNFGLIKKNIKRNFKINDPDLQGILIGSQNDKKSKALYSGYSKILHDLKIPFSELKNSKDPVNVAYSSHTDEWIINSKGIENDLTNGYTKRAAIENNFGTVNLSELDYFA